MVATLGDFHGKLSEYSKMPTRAIVAKPRLKMRFQQGVVSCGMGMVSAPEELDGGSVVEWTRTPARELRLRNTLAACCQDPKCALGRTE